MESPFESSLTFNIASAFALFFSFKVPDILQISPVQDRTAHDFDQDQLLAENFQLGTSEDCSDHLDNPSPTSDSFATASDASSTTPTVKIVQPGELWKLVSQAGITEEDVLKEDMDIIRKKFDAYYQVTDATGKPTSQVRFQLKTCPLAMGERNLGKFT